MFLRKSDTGLWLHLWAEWLWYVRLTHRICDALGLEWSPVGESMGYSAFRICR
jgi:hypothetical protein